MLHSSFSGAAAPAVWTLRASVLATLLALSACGGDNAPVAEDVVETAPVVIPAAPAGLGYTDSAPLPDVPAFVDYAHTNQRDNPCMVGVATNAGVRVLSGFLDIWTPSTQIVDAGVNLAAANGCPAVTASAWSGVPGTSPDGTVVNAVAHAENIAFSTRITVQRTAEQAIAAYYDDRRGKNYSVTDGMGPFTGAWRKLARQTTTINDIPTDASTQVYNDGGNNTGVAGAANPEFGQVIAFVQSMGSNASTEPAKRFYKYARPWRWSNGVVVQPTLLPARSGTPATDGGFPSGHTAESVRNAIAMAYVVPERFQEMLARGLELGENRIVAGMHSPLDVMGGRVLGQASALGNIYAATPESRAAAYAQAQQALRAEASAKTDAEFLAAAQVPGIDHAAAAASYRHRLTFDFAQTGAAGKAAVVPKGAEVLLETRLPYLSPEQRRVVLKTTAIASGYPAMDDAEGFGRLNLFAAADGFGAFNGDVAVTMDASRGGFHAADTWRNAIGGAGKLTKLGTGSLTLAGSNAYSGGTQVQAGTLVAASAGALGQGVVHLDGTGTLKIAAGTAAKAGADFTQAGDAVLEVTAGNAAALQVAGKATLGTGSLLRVHFGAGTSAGQVIPVIQAGALLGRFGRIELPAGVNASPVYEAGGMGLRVQ
ncbi:acid phosphatase [Comamonas antarctica]|uniref:Phosphatase PAP2 family protein n=1 Tax=Comamonas antarctica TaxID=2743470 RepID=A0A6N1X5Y3_9BURK|nr:phosphatase PAP2 family protein [Comamonas antarctica]QKV54747.1 phosphatase PAP2 family protein [Comamonas antarctica]